MIFHYDTRSAGGSAGSKLAVVFETGAKVEIRDAATLALLGTAEALKQPGSLPCVEWSHHRQAQHRSGLPRGGGEMTRKGIPY